MFVKGHLRSLAISLILVYATRPSAFPNENKNIHDRLRYGIYAYDHHNSINSNATLPNIYSWEDNEEIKFFREYLRIKTVHPDVDYEPAVAFLKKQAVSLNLPTEIHYPVDNLNPVLVMTWKGSEPDLPSIMLNAHMDVVPVFEQYWTHPPFAAEMDENGDIFARGAQDMKSVGMQYLAAIRALKRNGIDQFKRTIHIVYVPDEELGERGMAGFVKTIEFKSLNVAIMLDEGGSVLQDDGSMNVYYGERTRLQTEFIFHGQSGHGSKLINDTPGEKLNYLVGQLMELRKEEAYKLSVLKYPYGNVTTINLTLLKGGIQNNVIPAELSVTFDIRVSINTDVDDFKLQLNRFCDEAGGNITINYLANVGKGEKLTVVDDSNPFWVAYKSAFDELGVKVSPAILTGTTDSRYIRRMNISALGFTPLLHTIPRQHDHNEYMNADDYLTGIEFFKKIIPKLANV